jgi:cell division protein FtsI (penicillin-binding protein 3)
MGPEKTQSMRKRMAYVQAILMVSVFLLIAKSFDLQVFRADELAKKAENDYSRYVTIKGERGQILDRNMNELATSTYAVSITACPKNITDPETTAAQLSRILGLSRKKLLKKLNSGRMFAWVARKISPAQKKRIEKLHLKGIYFQKDSRRFYPNRSLAAQVLGFTGSDGNGLEGLEFKYNPLLSGKSAKIRIKKNGKGEILELDKETELRLKGRSIVLTIDKKIQFLSEQALERAVRIHRAKSGIAIVMRPSTGEILSMAHYPEFNPNNFSGYSMQVFRNRSVTDAFEPGSTIKVFTAAAALEKGFSPKSIFFCKNGNYKIGSFTIHDTHPHGWLSINQIIKYSSNIGAALITKNIGEANLYHYLKAFGFGTRTGVGCPGETSGNLIPLKKWSKIDAGAIAFGQGISVSAVQLASAVSAIANNGVLMKPMLIKKIISGKGKILRQYEPEPVRRVISEKTAKDIRHMMRLVVEKDGTGTKADLQGYDVCGKTGTAQKALKNKKGYSNTRYTSVFAGFAPKDHPKLAIVVVVDEPENQYYGGDVAAPAFRDILAESFNYLNIPPEKKDQTMIASLSEGAGN